MKSDSLAISARQRREIARCAQAAFPEECCGILLGRASEGHERTVERVVETSNASDSDRRRSYMIPPERLLEVHDAARARGEVVVGFYHSHPDGGARPSRWDERTAWAGMSYLIAPRGGEMTSWRRGLDGRLREEALIEPPARRALLGSASR